MNHNLIIPTAEPFFFSGNSTGIILVHGFTGTPKEMRGLGVHLNKQGFTTLGIRLSGHATQPSDLARTRWWDWLCSIEDGINILNKQCKKIFLVGLSLGGILTLVAAANYSVQGVVALATPYSLPEDWRLRIAKPLSLFFPKVEKGESDLIDQDSLKTHVDYPFYPTRSIAELYDLTKNLHAILPKLKVPLLLINSKNDHSVPVEHSHLIRGRVGSRDVTQFFLEKSGHVLTEDIEKDQVYAQVKQFITTKV